MENTCVQIESDSSLALYHSVRDIPSLLPAYKIMVKIVHKQGKTQPPHVVTFLPTENGIILHHSNHRVLILAINSMFASEIFVYNVSHLSHIAIWSIRVLMTPSNRWCMGVSMHWSSVIRLVHKAG